MSGMYVISSRYEQIILLKNAGYLQMRKHIGMDIPHLTPTFLVAFF